MARRFAYPIAMKEILRKQVTGVAFTGDVRIAKKDTRSEFQL